MKRSATLALVIFIAGCGLFSRSKSTFYSLDRIPGTVVAASGAPVGIDSLELPPGFDRRDVVVRQANQQLDVRSTEQWSANLQPLVLHTLAFDLAARLPEGMVILPGAAKPLGAMRTIDVVFEELAAGPENQLVLDARWKISETSGAAIAGHERIAVPLESLASANVAAGTSQALAQLADRLATQIAR